MDGLVHGQSLDHALHVVHQTLEADTAQGLIHLHQDEEGRTIQHLQGEGKRNVHDHHQEVLLEEKKMENTVAGPIPLAMKVLLMQTGTETETMRLEKNLAMKERKGVVVEELFQGRHRDPGPDLWRCLLDETYVKKACVSFSLSQTKTVCATLYGFLSLYFASSGLYMSWKLPTLACYRFFLGCNVVT